MLGCLEQAVSGGLVGREAEERQIAFFTSLVKGFVAAALLLSTTAHGEFRMGALAALVCVIAQTAMAVLCLTPARLTQTAVAAWLIATSSAYILADIDARSTRGQSVWPLFVLVTDLSLLMRLDRRFGAALVISVTVWMLLAFLESVTRFGLFDLPLTAPQAERATGFDCHQLPCAADVQDALFSEALGAVVFVCDFVVTRRFAEAAVRQHDEMLQTIDTVQHIASLLAGYDVDAVSDLLTNTEGSLPHGMHEALRGVEQHLRLYRSYLPKSSLPCLALAEARIPDDPPPHYTASWSATMPGVLSGTTPADTTGTVPDIAEAATLRQIGLLHQKRATVMFVNIKASIAMLKESECDFGDFFTELLEAVAPAVEGRHGMVEFFAGDRIQCSFNASRACSQHASAALHAAKKVVKTLASCAGDVPINMGIASGTLCCGDVGSPDIRRFCLLGPLTIEGSAMERAGSALSLHIACNAAAKREAECEHQIRLVPCTVLLLKLRVLAGRVTEVPACSAGPQLVCDVLTGEDDLTSPRHEAGQEWLYVIGDKASMWVHYNAAVEAFLRGDDLAAVLSRAGDKREELHAAIQLQGSQEGLRLHI